MSDKGHIKDTQALKTTNPVVGNDAFVLDKAIFSNIFEKDIRRVYIYKKTERLAKAIHLITPAFSQSPALRSRIEGISIGLIDAVILPPSETKLALSKELLTLSSLLSLARSSALVSEMNADFISREAHLLLGEIADYQEPRLFMDHVTTLAELFKSSTHVRADKVSRERKAPEAKQEKSQPALKDTKGHIKDTPRASGRREAILDVLRSKGPSYIKDISTVIIDVSEKTIQRELSSLVSEGVIEKNGDRRWTTYSLA